MYPTCCCCYLHLLMNSDYNEQFSRCVVFVSLWSGSLSGLNPLMNSQCLCVCSRYVVYVFLSNAALKNSWQVQFATFTRFRAQYISVPDNTMILRGIGISCGQTKQFRFSFLREMIPNQTNIWEWERVLFRKWNVNALDLCLWGDHFKCSLGYRQSCHMFHVVFSSDCLGEYWDCTLR